MKFLKHVSVLLVMVLLCTTMTLCASAATIPAEGSIWKPSEAPAYEPAEPTFYPIVIEKAENGSAKSSVVSAAAGTTVTITVVPEDGFSLKQLQLVDPSGNPISFKKISDTQYTFVMPSCRVTVRSAFRPQASLCPRDESCPCTASPI